MTEVPATPAHRGGRIAKTRGAACMRNVWFHLSLAVGSLLRLLLLLQSIATYYQVSRILVTAELRRQGLRQTANREEFSAAGYSGGR
jgi:hypothetical protein